MASQGKEILEEMSEFETMPVKLTQPLDMSEVCSETGTVIEVSADQFSTTTQSELDNSIFGDQALLSSLSLGCGNPFGDEDNSDDEADPFEKLAKKMEELTDDGGVLKMIVEPGVGGDIPDKAVVTFHYTTYQEFEDEPIDSTYLRGKPERKLVDSGEMLPGLNIAIKSMRKSEVARFLIKPQYAFGKVGCPPRIPGNETLLYEVKVVSYLDRAAADAYEELDEQEKSAVTFQEKVKAAQGYHRQGNEYYKEGNLRGAKNSYFRAAWIMENARLADQAEEAKRDSLLAKMRSNLAQVYTELKEPARACTQCHLALKLSHNHSDDIKAKLHYRLGKALVMLNNFKAGQKELMVAQSLKPNNPDIGRELEQLLAKKQKYETQERFMCQKMFSSFKEKEHQAAGGDEVTVQEKKEHCSGVLPAVSPEFQQIVEARIDSFTTNSDIHELPFPTNLSQAEVTYIATAAKAANCSVFSIPKGRNSFLKIVKKV